MFVCVGGSYSGMSRRNYSQQNSIHIYMNLYGDGEAMWCQLYDNGYFKSSKQERRTLLMIFI